jgi:hypothetical protein
MNSRQNLAEHGFGERSDFFRENALSQKNRRFETAKNAFLAVSCAGASYACAGTLYHL